MKCYVLVSERTGKLYRPSVDKDFGSFWRLYGIKYRKCQEELGTGMVTFYPIAPKDKKTEVFMVPYSTFILAAKLARTIKPYKPGSKIVEEREAIPLSSDLFLVTTTQSIEGV